MADHPRSVTVTLLFPVQDKEGREIATLTFRRMKAKDTLAAEGEQDPARAGYLLYAALAGVDLDVILELDIEDLETVSEALVPLMGKSAAKLVKEAKAAATPSSGAT